MVPSQTAAASRSTTSRRGSFTTPPSPHYPVERATLDNGLRVVLAPDRGTPAIGVAIYYDVGMRSEPVGRTGFAHLFEHLMFEGSASLAKHEHARLVQSSGGSMNGFTHLDYTCYHEVLPSNALERGIFLEADRMRAPLLTEETMVNQISVVKEEIRVNVLNRPYGSFPWLQLPPLMFDTFANTHNGYGDFVDLESATVEDAKAFFDRYYAPGNAVLSIAGDLDPEATFALVERHFGDIPQRTVAKRPDFAEPALVAPRHQRITDPLAPAPALALGWQTPDPVKSLREYLAYVVLSEILSDGDASRLERRLVRGDRIAIQQAAYTGLIGDPFNVRAANTFIIEVHHPVDVAPDTVVSAIDDELGRIATDGPNTEELNRVLTRITAQLLRGVDPVLQRTLRVGGFELVHARGELLNDLPGLLSGVTAGDVTAAARALSPQSRAVLELEAGAAR